MTFARKIEIAVNNVPIGTVFSIPDLHFPPVSSANIKVKLNRMVRAGRLQKLVNGKYYRAMESVFGATLPSTEELVKDILYTDGKISGYLTGNSVWTSMQLTTQFSGTITVGVNARKASIRRAGQKIMFIVQHNKITSENIHLLQILDALKFIKKIPDTTVSASFSKLNNIIKHLSEKDLKAITKLSMKYPPRVRAALGAILYNGEHNDLTDTLYASLNQISEYKFGITTDIMLNTSKWHIK